MKLMIFGIVASGKTTLARKLSKQFNVPHYEGDCIAWGFPGEERYKRSDIEQEKVIFDIDKKGNWIIEGTYRESQKCLFDLAENIIYLDTPLRIRKFRIVTRFIKQKFGIENCNYKPTLEMFRLMFKWTNDFERNKYKYEEMLQLYKHKLIRVKSVKELKRTLVGFNSHSLCFCRRICNEKKVNL